MNILYIINYYKIFVYYICGKLEQKIIKMGNATL
jgi:hypothetical protein